MSKMHIPKFLTDLNIIFSYVLMFNHLHFKCMDVELSKKL